MKVVHSITGPQLPHQVLGFSVWARGNPKDYLMEYPNTAHVLSSDKGFESVKVIALVDDVLPLIKEGRSVVEQDKISIEYSEKMPKYGFDAVYLVSSFVPVDFTWGYLKFASRFTGSEFMKLLPKSKRETGELFATEIVGFLWHLYVMEIAMKRFHITGFLAGIRSEFFYLAARQVLPQHDVHFLSDSS